MLRLATIFWVALPTEQLFICLHQKQSTYRDLWFIQTQIALSFSTFCYFQMKPSLIPSHCLKRLCQATPMALSSPTTRAATRWRESPSSTRRRMKTWSSCLESPSVTPSSGGALPLLFKVDLITSKNQVVSASKSNMSVLDGVGVICTIRDFFLNSLLF